jgi:hypothetical protein
MSQILLPKIEKQPKRERQAPIEALNASQLAKERRVVRGD